MAIRFNTSRIWAIGYLVVVLGLVSLFVSDSRQDEFDKRRGADIAQGKAETLQCMEKVFTTYLTGTAELREASRLRDQADYKVKELAIDKQLPLSDPRVQRAWAEYRDAADVLTAERRDNPPPNYRKICK